MPRVPDSNPSLSQDARSVFYFEDNAEYFQLCTDWLREHRNYDINGHGSFSAASLAIKHMIEEPYMAVLDIQDEREGVMDAGFQLLALLRNKFPRAGVIFLTGQGGQDYRTMAESSMYDVDHFVEKDEVVGRGGYGILAHKIEYVRRRRERFEISAHSPGYESLTRGAVSLFQDGTQRVSWNSMSFELAPKAFMILEFLVEKAPTPCPIAKLAEVADIAPLSDQAAEEALEKARHQKAGELLKIIFSLPGFPEADQGKDLDDLLDKYEKRLDSAEAKAALEAYSDWDAKSIEDYIEIKLTERVKRQVSDIRNGFKSVDVKFGKSRTGSGLRSLYGTSKYYWAAGEER